MRNKRNAFTLIELLVVIAIIAVLVAILAPMMVNIAERGRQLICLSYVHQISIAFNAYLKASHGFSHWSPGGAGGCGYWEIPRGTPLRPNHQYAYWGVAYSKYAEGDRRIFRCPSARATDCDNYPATVIGNMPADWPAQPWVSYGLNRHISKRSSFTITNPAETIICHDAHEHLLEGINRGLTDALSAWGVGLNITQWRNCRRAWCRHDPSRMGPHRRHQEEYYRHLDTCSVLWYDGHVTSIPESDGTDVPSWWYTGG